MQRLTQARSLLALSLAFLAMMFVVSLKAGNIALVPGHQPDAVGTTASVFQDGRASERGQSELITLRPTGFEPDRLTRPAGRFLLLVNNQSGVREISLRLRTEDQRQLSETRFARNKVRAGQVLDLSPGNFELVEASHPDWVCRLVVTK